jgi:hypothetical protein
MTAVEMPKSIRAPATRSVGGKEFEVKSKPLPMLLERN